MPGGEGRERQRADAALHLAVDDFVRHGVEHAVAVGRVQQRPLERSPGVAVDPDNSAGERSIALVIQTTRLPHGIVARVGDVVVAPEVAVEAARRGDQVDAVLRRPVAFLVGDEQGAVRVEAHAVRGAEAVGQDVGARAVGADAQQRAVLRHQRGQRVPGAFGVVEVARRVGLQAHGELVKVLRHLVVVVEVLVEVGFAVAVQVAQDHDLVAAADVDLGRGRSSAPAAGTGRKRSAARSAPVRAGRRRTPARRRRPSCRPPPAVRRRRSRSR